MQHALDTLDKNCDESHGGILDKFQGTISGELNSQNVANTLWAFATMGTKPRGADDESAGAAGGGDIR